MKKIITTIVLLVAFVTQAQEAPTTGFLLPRHTTSERDALVNPAKGLTIFNTTTNAQEINTGTSGTPVWSIVVVGGSAVPAGAVFHMATATVPAGYLECNGQAVSRTTYATLFAVVGTTYGAGDGSTTFNLPDLRGEFIRGWDHGRGVDSGRAIATYQADALQNITGGVYTVAESFNGNGSASGAFAKTGGYNSNLTPSSTDTSGAGAFDFDASRVVRTAAETRPRNRALMPVIKF